MLKLLILGMWAVMVTAASVYFSASYLSQSGGEHPVTEGNLGIEQISTDMTSVPMVRGGAIQGYVIIQLSFAADRARLEHLKIDPAPYLIDAAFRAIYGSSQTDFTRLRPSEIDELTDTIGKLANQHLGEPLVKQVLIQQLNYVRREDVRTNWIKQK